MDINEGTTTEDLWTPFKELVAVVDSYLANEGSGVSYAVHTFETILRRHKQTFLALLKNPVKNQASREEIKRGITEGVNLPSIGKTLLSKELVDEAIILSDMYNANEYACLELLHTAQRQTARRPGLARGLLAVILYYDGRRSLVQALRDLVMARDGVSWSISAREEIVNYVSRYVEQLVSDGVLGAALDALRRTAIEPELEVLRRYRALPPRRYYNRMMITMQTTRKLLAGVIFAASAQRGLERDILIRLLSEQMSLPSRGATGALDEISLALQMALLYAIDLSVLHRREDGEELAKKLPLIQDPDLIAVLLDELSPTGQPNQTQESEGKSGGLKALCQLAFGLALAALKRAPVSLLRRSSELKCELLDQDEILVDAAIDGGAFEYLEEAILSTDMVAAEEWYQRRVHSLITDFIVLMHSKLMEMRVKAEEAARAAAACAAEGVSGGARRPRLLALLRCVERLYARDPLRLRDDYWRAADHTHAHTWGGAGAGVGGGRAAVLYKWVRASGEVVVAALLGGYLRALAALAVPRHTWALLARRDALSAHHLLTALALYHRNLRADPSPLSELSHAPSLGASGLAGARPARLLVRQEEVEAMIAALRLIAAVAREDEAACAAICDNMQWDAVNVMFGLICCAVPLALKAELAGALAALGGRAGAAPRVWAALDAAHLVAADRRALAADLEEVECRMEEYPLSRAFVELLTSLSGAAPLPRALGAGARPPGLDPYVHHVVTRIALPAPHRNYRQPHEKWQVLSLCFRLFVKWLDAYEPAASDFPPPHAEPDINPPPGFRLLIQLHTDSELLRLTLTTLDEAFELMDRQPSPEQVYIEETLNSVLQLLERALTLERPLNTAAAAAGRAALVVGLSKLILAPSGTESGDRLVTCCRVLQLVSVAPSVAARAVALLCRALAAPAAPRHLLETVAHRHQLANEIRQGFVECLEAGGEAAEAGPARGAAEGVVALLLQLLPAAPHNLAHLLLGYQVTDDVSRSVLSETPRTCLHAILDILDAFIADNSEKEASTLVESGYRLVYWMCARAATSAPALRLLRARDYFLARHLKATINLEKASMSSISARSWVVRACACEAGAAGASAHAAALAALLAAAAGTHRPPQEWEWCVLRKLLEGLAVRAEPAPEPRWELFHAHQLRQALAECDLPTGLGGKRISVTRVHALLSRELASLRASAPQRNLVAQEIKKVLDYVTEVNKQRNLAATLTHYYDSWRQLTEIIFCVAPQDLLSLDTRKNLLLNILQDLLNKIPPTEVLPQIGNLASGTILLLLVNLRHCYILQKRESSLKSSEFEASFFGPSNQIMQTKSLTLKFILHKILSWIMVSGACTQKMRVNLYGALLNFLNIVNLKPSAADPEEEVNTTYVSRLDSSRVKPSKEESTLKSMVIDVIDSFGESLCAVVCSDCIGGGHDVCRMVALSCLDTLIEINPVTDWLHVLTNQGYLRSLIDSLIQDDEGLKEALEPNPKSLRVLYVYESKMALLVRLAGSRGAAETLLAAGALSALAQLTALAAHPDVHAPADQRAFVPPAAERFRQILSPALALCDALLTTLGADNYSLVLQITHLLLAHLECVDMILRAAHPHSSLALLREAEAVCCVASRAWGGAAGAALAADAAGVRRVRALLLALLPRFAAAPPPSDSPDDDSDTADLHYKILCHLLLFARGSLESGADEGSAGAGRAALVLLRPLLRAVHAHRKLLATVTTQLHNAPSMTLPDIKKLVGGDISGAGNDTNGRAGAVSRLRARALRRRRELTRCEVAAHAALYLVWAHARRQLRTALAPHCEPKGTALSVGGAEEATELRKELIAVFSDRFTDDLLDTTKNQAAVQRGFLEVLIKDIRTMVQFSPL